MPAIDRPLGVARTPFTPTEARLAEALANGKTIAEIAAINRANIETVRKQIKSIFAKTGTKRQAECVALILSAGMAVTKGLKQFKQVHAAPKTIESLKENIEWAKQQIK